jgi:cytochrome c-type biogenesis protein CcmE
LEGAGIAFVVTDTAHDVTVRYAGLLPDLFREGQGVVANGRLTAEGVFVAEEVLARHDESYMPPEAAEALARAGEGPLTAPRASGNDAARPPGVYGQDSLATQGSSQ